MHGVKVISYSIDNHKSFLTFFLIALHPSYLFFQLAKAEKLKPLEVELKRLEDLSESIVNDFAYMRAREEEMRDTNGKTCGK